MCISIVVDPTIYLVIIFAVDVVMSFDGYSFLTLGHKMQQNNLEVLVQTA